MCNPTSVSDIQLGERTCFKQNYLPFADRNKKNTMIGGVGLRTHNSRWENPSQKKLLIFSSFFDFEVIPSSAIFLGRVTDGSGQWLFPAMRLAQAYHNYVKHYLPGHSAHSHCHTVSHQSCHTLSQCPRIWHSTVYIKATNNKRPNNINISYITSGCLLLGIKLSH